MSASGYDALSDETCAALYHERVIRPKSIGWGIPDFIVDKEAPAYILSVVTYPDAVKEIREHLNGEA